MPPSPLFFLLRVVYRLPMQQQCLWSPSHQVINKCFNVYIRCYYTTTTALKMEEMGLTLNCLQVEIEEKEIGKWAIY